MLNPFANRKILRHGLPSRATIIDMPPLEGSRAVNVALVLRIDRAGEHPYEIRDHFMISAEDGLAIDDAIHVMVDPKNPHRVVIDWEKTREAVDRRRNAISQVVSPGVPVPVSRVRDAIEEVDPGHFARLQNGRPRHDEVDPYEAAGEEVSVDLESPESLTSSLERLAALHADGALTDGEFAAAKRHVLTGA